MRPSTTLGSLLLASAGLALVLAGCGDEETKTTSQRGMPAGTQPIGQGGGAPAANKAPAGGGSRRSGPPQPAGQGEEEEPEAEINKRPTPVLTRDDFSGRTRDPFHNYMAMEMITEAPEPVEVVTKQREVKLSEYPFDDLRLIAIVNAGRNVSPTALFLSSTDSKSKSVKQGEYFSSAEVLLASVNRDYIEIEIIDPELTPGWNMERGERRVIYLKD